jgi:hypothetical protein
MSPKRRSNDSVLEAGKMNLVSFLSYSFLELRGLSRMTPEDHAFLNSKGCLQLPARDLLDDFIRQYFLNCQLSTPIIDEAHFWKVYRSPQNEKAPKISLLFFQAMLFASSPYVSLESAQACGFEDGRAAWNAFYQRAKVRHTTYFIPQLSDSLT